MRGQRRATETREEGEGGGRGVGKGGVRGGGKGGRGERGGKGGSGEREGGEKEGTCEYEWKRVI